MSKKFGELYVDMPDEVRRSIKNHEVLLSFGADDDATLFVYWWNDEGKKNFEKWREKHSDWV